MLREFCLLWLGQNFSTSQHCATLDQFLLSSHLVLLVLTESYPAFNYTHVERLNSKSPYRFFFFKRNSRSFLFIYLFIHDCVESSFLCEGSPQLRQAGTTLHRGARASHHRGLPCCGAQAPDAQAQQLWLTGPVAPRHAGSSQTRARTRVPCISRQILNHCATREALNCF